jgi:hypothetical protein
LCATAGEINLSKLMTVTLRFIITVTSALVIAPQILAQDNAIPKGVANDLINAYAFTNDTIYPPNGGFLQDGALQVRNG